MSDWEVVFIVHVHVCVPNCPLLCWPDCGVQVGNQRRCAWLTKFTVFSPLSTSDAFCAASHMCVCVHDIHTHTYTHARTHARAHTRTHTHTHTASHQQHAWKSCERALHQPFRKQRQKTTRLSARQPVKLVRLGASRRGAQRKLREATGARFWRAASLCSGHGENGPVFR